MFTKIIGLIDLFINIIRYINLSLHHINNNCNVCIFIVENYRLTVKQYFEFVSMFFISQIKLFNCDIICVIIISCILFLLDC